MAVLSINAHGQIKVNSDGKVNLGTTDNLCNYFQKIFCNGNTCINGFLNFNSGGILGPFQIDPNVNYNPILFVEDVWGDTGIIPGQNNSCSVGSSVNNFFDIYSHFIYADVLTLTSDKRKKENIRDIESPLSKILQIKGQKYDFKNEGLDSIKNEKKRIEIDKKNKNRLGFLAQDIQPVIPEAVIYEEEEDKYYIDYIAIIPVIVEAMKEQQATIDALTARIEKLEGSSKEKSASVISSKGEALVTDLPALAQNIPNPFGTTTRIDVYLPNSVSTAKLYVYNMVGAQIKAIPITDRGNTSVIIEGYSLGAGMYLYTLIADGKEVDTKKMILTKQ